jgi:phage-related protein
LNWQVFLQLARTAFQGFQVVGGLGGGVSGDVVRGAGDALRILEELEGSVAQVNERLLQTTRTAQDFFTALTEGALRATGALLPLLRLLGQTPWLGEFSYAASTLTFFFNNLTQIIVNLSEVFQTFIAGVSQGLGVVTNVIHTLLSGFSQSVRLVTELTTKFINFMSSLIQTVAKTLMAGGPVLGAIAGAIIGAIVGAYGTGVGALPGAVEGAKIGGIIGGILGTILGGALGVANTIISQFLSGILGAFGVIGQLLAQVLNTALSVVTQALQQILNAFRFAVAMLTRIFTEFLQTISAMWQMFGAVAARAETVSVALQVLARNAGISRREILGLWEALSKQNISLIEGGNAMVMLMARFPQLGLLTGRLAEAAKDWAAAMGFVSSEVLRDFAVAVARGEISMLEHLNIVYASSTAWQLYAAQLGKAAQDLNALERSLAVADFLINQIGRSVRGMYEETFDTLGKLLTSFQRVFQEVQIVAGRELLGAYSAIGRTFYSILQVVKESEGIKTLFRAIGTGIMEGLQRVFGATTFPKDPEQNPIARTLRAILDSPQFRQAAMQLGGVVAGLTEMLARGLLNLLNNLPQILERLINFFRIIYVILIGIMTAARFIWQAFVNWITGLLGVNAQLGSVYNAIELITKGIAKFGELLAAAITWVGNNFPQILNKIAEGLTFIGELVGKLWDAFIQLATLVIDWFLSPLLVALQKIFWALSYIPGLGGMAAVAEALGETVDSLQILSEALKTYAPSGEDIAAGFQKVGDALTNIGAWVEENFPAFAPKVKKFFDDMASAVENSMTNAAKSTEALTRTMTYNFKQVEEQGNRIITLFRTWATQAQILQDATRSLIDYYKELYGTVGDVVALSFVNAIQAWREVEAAFTNIQVVLTVLRDPERFRLIEPMMLEEMYRDFVEALAKWARAVNEVFRVLSDIVRETDRLVDSTTRLTQLYTFGANETLRLLNLRRQLLLNEIQILNYWASLPLGYERRLDVTKRLVDAHTELVKITQEELRLITGLTEQYARVLAGIGENMERLAGQVFFAPLMTMQGFLLRLRATMLELWANWLVIQRALMVGDIPYEQYAEALRRYNAAVVQALESLVNALTRPLQQVTSMLDNQIRYWRTARDMVNSFNLGMYATLSVHMAEAQILVEKLRTLELMAQVNRYNADIYWRIRAEIINIKRELLDIARRPIFIFGLTREQIEASFRDFSRMMADPRFWLRWRLAGPMLPEMALRMAIWAQQPGMAAIPVFDPRFIAMLGLPQALAAFPLFRWWGLVQEVTGRRTPLDVRTLIQAMGMGLLAEIFGVPRPFMGMPPLSYFFNLIPQVQRFVRRFGVLPDPFLYPLSPFQPVETGVSALIQPVVDQLREMRSDLRGWMSQVVQQARTINQILTFMANLHAFYMPRIDAHLAQLLGVVAGRRISGFMNIPPEAFRDPRAFVGYRRQEEREIAGLREGFTGGVPFPTRRQVFPRVGFYQQPAAGIQVPVTMGNRPIGTLNLNPAALQEWAMRIAIQVMENMALGYPPFVPTQ